MPSLITINEQIAFQRGKPFVAPNIYEFECSMTPVDEGETPTSGTLATKNPLFPGFTNGRKILVTGLEGIGDVELKYQEETLLLKAPVALIPEKMYILEVRKNKGEGDEENNGELGIIDMEDYTTDPMYYGYYSVVRCINSAINYAEKYIGYQIRPEHFEFESECRCELEEMLHKWDGQNVRNVDYEWTEEDEIWTISFDIGYDILPADLKQAIMSCANSFYCQYGDLARTQTPQGRTSFAFDDLVKNILAKYKRWGVLGESGASGSDRRTQWTQQ
mgnify:CR=1 FL=1